MGQWSVLTPRERAFANDERDSSGAKPRAPHSVGSAVRSIDAEVSEFTVFLLRNMCAEGPADDRIKKIARTRLAEASIYTEVPDIDIADVRLRNYGVLGKVKLFRKIDMAVNCDIISGGNRAALWESVGSFFVKTELFGVLRNTAASSTASLRP